MCFVIAAEPEETNPLEDDNDQLPNPLELVSTRQLLSRVETEPDEILGQSQEGSFSNFEQIQERLIQ